MRGLFQVKNKIKRSSFFIFLTIFLSSCPVVLASEQVFSTTIYSDTTKNIEKTFKENLQKFGELVYTIVPQGLVISMRGDFFFEYGQTKLLERGKSFLTLFAEIFQQLPNSCVIEVNSDALDCNNSIEYWETTIRQANQIEKYLIKERNIAPNKIRSIGFGEIIPNFPKEKTFPNRVDFVILEYNVTP